MYTCSAKGAQHRIYFACPPPLHSSLPCSRPIITAVCLLYRQKSFFTSCLCPSTEFRGSRNIHRRILTAIVRRQSARSSSTSTGLRGQQQPTSKAAVQYPKVDALTLVGDDLNAMVSEIHDELQSELKSDIELSEMSK